MDIINEILNNKYLLRDLLKIYAGILKEQKQIHWINCPKCDKDRPCKRYYWLFIDWQAAEWLIQKLDIECKHQAG